MRFWCKKLMDHQCPDKKDMTTRDRWLTFISTLVDGAIIGLLIYTIMANSCQICYNSGFAQDTYTKCKSYSDVMENGLPEEIIELYEGQEAYDEKLKQDAEELGMIAQSKLEGTMLESI